MEKINPKWLEKTNKEYLNNKTQTIVRRALFKSDLNSFSRVMEEVNHNQFKFSHEIPTMEATNQKASGRCWIFAGLNVLREIIGKKYNIENFEFSQNYVAFYDKLEKINFYFESVLKLLDVPADDRTLVCINENGIQDGGQWDMLVSIIEKYGLVSKNAMPETFSSSNTRKMNSLINIKLKQFCAKARELHQNKQDAKIKELKEEYLKDAYTLLCSCFGVPPTKFDFEYINKNKEYKIEKNITPLQFYKEYVGDILQDYVSIINSPTKDKPFNKVFTVEYIGNVVGGHPIKYLNLPMNEMKKLAIKQIKDKEVVWFGSDCGKDGDREAGFWDDKSYDYDSTFETSFDLSKEAMLDYRYSAMNHAMVLTAVNLDGTKSTKWKIENSWGTEKAKKGYHVCSDSWFDKYVYQIVINKKHLTKAQLKLLEGRAIKLHPWDPMGTLAD